MNSLYKVFPLLILLFIFPSCGDDDSNCNDSAADCTGICRDWDGLSCKCETDGFYEGVCLNAGNSEDYDYGTCSCICIGGWQVVVGSDGSEACTHCPILPSDCQNGGAFDADSCLCDCPVGWMGTYCDAVDTNAPGAFVSFEATVDTSFLGLFKESSPTQFILKSDEALIHAKIDSIEFRMRLNQPGDTLKEGSFPLSTNPLEHHIVYIIKNRQYNVVSGTLIIEKKTGVKHLKGRFSGNFKDIQNQNLAIADGQFWIRN